MLRIKPIVSKISNNYFFVSNLAEWHQSCRKKYNEHWLKDKPLTEREKKMLARFAEIHKEYGFDNTNFYLGRLFFLSDDPWQALSQKTPYGEEIKEIFDSFNDRFEAVWNDAGRQLLHQGKVITDFFNNREELNEEISKTLLLFYSLNQPKSEDIKLFLLLSTNNMIGGGANIKPLGITLESSGWTGNNEKIFSVLWHELVHICYESYDHLPASTRDLIDSRIREALVSALFPNGHLANKYFHLEDRSSYSHLVKRYIDCKDKLDTALIYSIKNDLAKT